MGGPNTVARNVTLAQRQVDLIQSLLMREWSRLDAERRRLDPREDMPRIDHLIERQTIVSHTMETIRHATEGGLQ